MKLRLPVASCLTSKTYLAPLRPPVKVKVVGEPVSVIRCVKAKFQSIVTDEAHVFVRTVYSSKRELLAVVRASISADNAGTAAGVGFDTE